ncbi:MAG: MBL fold metallo-hydrolase [Longimicrobiales bacterium]
MSGWGGGFRRGLVVMVALLVWAAAAPPAGAQEPRTRVVMLGFGTPNADPGRSGPAVAVVVDDRAYLVDAGPGVVRRAALAADSLGIEALRVDRLHHVFLSHLHSDHTLGMPDLLLSPWVLDRPDPLQVFGPPGTAAMMDAIVEAWSQDIDMRVNGTEPRDANASAYRPVVEELTDGGLVYEDDLVRIYAVPVIHGSWQYAYGYRFVGPDRTVVVSGDAAPTEALVEACDGCDVLVHEVYSAERFLTRPPEWQRYHAAFHTSTDELAELATRARPGVLVLYHQLFWGTDDQGMLDEMRAAGYTGRVESGRDLGVW